MSIEAIGNACSAASVSAAGAPSSNLRQDFRGLESALLNGDLGGAQSAFASLQQAVSSAQGSANSNSVPAQLGEVDSTLGKDLQAVSNALGANDIGGAQKAFAQLQQDMRAAFQANGAGHAHHGRHAHHARAQDGDASGASSTQDPSAALATVLQSMSGAQSGGATAGDLLNALQSLASSNPKVAGDLLDLVSDLNTTGKIVNTTA